MLSLHSARDQSTRKGQRVHVWLIEVDANPHPRLWRLKLLGEDQKSQCFVTVFVSAVFWVSWISHHFFAWQNFSSGLNQDIFWKSSAMMRLVFEGSGMGAKSQRFLNTTSWLKHQQTSAPLAVVRGIRKFSARLGLTEDFCGRGNYRSLWGCEGGACGCSILQTKNECLKAAICIWYIGYGPLTVTVVNEGFFRDPRS